MRRSLCLKVVGGRRHLELGCRNGVRRRSFSFNHFGRHIRSRAMSVARARRRGSTTSVLGRHHGRVRRMVPVFWHWEAKGGEQIVWLIHAEWSSSCLSFEWQRWQGARPTDAIIFSVLIHYFSCFSRTCIKRDCLVYLALPLQKKLLLRRMEIICRLWRWAPSPTVGVDLADCFHVHLRWSWPRRCRF